MRMLRTQKSYFRMIHSANQLSIHGAVSSWSEEFAQKTPNQKESTSEKFVANENEQLQKKCEAARSEFFSANFKRVIIGHLETDYENVFRDLKTLEHDIQFTRVCEDASFCIRVSIGMSYNTILDVDDGFGGRTPACRKYALRRANSDSRLVAADPTTNN